MKNEILPLRNAALAGETVSATRGDGLKDIVIFTGSLDFNVRWNIAMLADRFAQIRLTVFVHKPRKSLAQIVKNQVRNVRYHGWRWLPYQAGSVLSKMSAPRKRPLGASAHRPGTSFELDELARHPRVEVRTFEDINGAEACEALKQIGAELGVALAAPILRERLFSLPRMGTINLHKGRLPDYRGMPPAFWELMNAEKEVGCTVHRVEPGLDTGAVLLARTVNVEKFATVAGVQTKLHHLGVNMICDAVDFLLRGEAKFTEQIPGGKTYRRPTLAVERKLNRVLARADLHGNVLRAAAKRALFAVYSCLFKPVQNRIRGLAGKQRVIILLYHRVSDQFRDNVTVGVEQFDRQMAYLAKHCTVISLREIVSGYVPRHSEKPVIAVSFDDGYRDNFENAAPILLRHRIPCTFFISTNKISENSPFDHDMKALGFGLDNMSWEQVRQMRNWGFDFGSHTCNHVNLAEVPEPLAVQELQESMADIRSMLGLDDVLIAYPYGRKHHITAERIELIKRIGYAACFSAYGGYNELPIDPFNIRRVGINWAFDMMAFRSRLHGWDNTV